MQLPDISKITTDKIHLPIPGGKRIELDMLRLDKIHPVISGNKWFKLKYHLEKFKAGNFNGLLTFGGAWSNHIVATACACFQQKIKSVGIIRGEKPAKLSFTLQDALNFNMELKFIPRELYRQKNSNYFLEQIKTEYPDFYIVPEGGAGAEGEKGAGEMLSLTDTTEYTHIVCAIGTATMFNGIAQSALPGQLTMGFVVLKGWEEMNYRAGSTVFYNYHFGGYAKHNPMLIAFMNDFYRHTGIPTDFVYTGKLVYAVNDLVIKDFFPDGNKVLLIHSGGLQGNTSLPTGTLIF